MGNSNDKSVLTEEDRAFLNEHTSVTKQDMAMYENFLLKHPDGYISRNEFRLLTFGTLRLLPLKKEHFYYTQTFELTFYHQSIVE